MTTQAVYIVRIGDSHVVGPPDRVETVLGSCLGLVLVVPERRVFGLAHIVMPRRTSAGGSPSRYALEAPQHLLDAMDLCRAERRKVRALLIGGAQLHVSEHHVGQSNFEVTNQVLRELGIRVIRRAVGGTMGRRVRVDAATAEVRVEVLHEGTATEEQCWKLVP